MAEDKEKSAEQPHPLDTNFSPIHKINRANTKVRAIPIPEWEDSEGKPLVLYAYPLTINDVIAIEGKGASQTEQNIYQIIHQCLNAQGEKYFTLIDKASLMNESADVIGRLLVKLNGESSSFTEELKKNNE